MKTTERTATPDLPPPLPETDRDEIIAHVEAYADRMHQMARQIWSEPELGYKEFKTSALFQDALTAEGFTIEAGVAGIPTAFVARLRTGPGPVIGIVAEMDALPGFSQAAVPVRQPIDGQTVGHACGHHLFGTGSVGAAVALGRWIRANDVSGEIRLFGTPAEEGGSGKVYMVRAGVFDGLDTVLHWHPDDRNMVWQSRSLASIGARFHFHGRSSHAASAPERGRSALHGVEAFHHMISLMREVVPRDTHIHYIVGNGGTATNVIPDSAESQVNMRHPEASVLADIFARVEKAAEGAALGTGTSVTVTRVGGVHSILTNDTLGRMMYANMLAAPRLSWDAAELDFAQTLQGSMDRKPDLANIAEVGPYTFDIIGAFSSDMGDVSWQAPTGALGTVTWVPGTSPHTWQAVAAGGTSIADKGTKLAAMVLAATGAHLFRAPEILARAKAEFAKARGQSFVYKPLIGDGPPPIDPAS